MEVRRERQRQGLEAYKKEMGTDIFGSRIFLVARPCYSLNFSVYRLQPLLQVKSKERQRRKFWKMIEE